MKKPVLLLLFTLPVLFSSAQINKKTPLLNQSPDFKGYFVDTFRSIGAVKRPDLNLVSKQKCDGPAIGKFEATGKHWYALESSQDSVYWAHVDCKHLIIELDSGMLLTQNGLLDSLIRYGISGVSDSSMFPNVQNFFELFFPSGDRNSVISICEKLKSFQGVRYIEPVGIVKSTACPPNDTYWGYQWGPYVIYADSVYCYFTGGSNQLVGVIDDAIDWYHEDLYNTVWYGYDFANNDSDPTPDFMSDDHGTHVTGTIAASINNGMGVAGIINDSIYAAKTVDNSGSLNISAILNAINSMASNPRIRTFNMSFGGYAPLSALENACNNAWNSGKLPIASAGNDNTSTMIYPAAYSTVVSVSAVGADISGNLISASYSNFGNWIDVSAP
jgi:hypothetical protein